MAVPRLEVTEIELPRSEADHDHFQMRQLPAYKPTSHALFSCWNGFVANSEA